LPTISTGDALLPTRMPILGAITIVSLTFLTFHFCLAQLVTEVSWLPCNTTVTLCIASAEARWSIHKNTLITEMECRYYAVRSKPLNVTDIKFYT